MLTKDTYWIEQPKFMGVRGWSMMFPLIGAAIGDFCFTVIALTYTEIGSFRPEFRLWFTQIGAITLAFGSAIGTLPTVVEIFRASDKPRYTDYIALGINGMTTLSAFVIAFAALLGKDAVVWTTISALWGPLFFGFLLMLDTIASAIVFGRYLRDYDKRMQEYQEQFNKDATRLAAWNGLTVAPEQEQVQYTQASQVQQEQPVAFAEDGTAIMQQTLDRMQQQPVPLAPVVADVPETLLHCWCGKELKSPKAYSAHLRTHIKDIRACKTVIDAKKMVDGIIVEGGDFPVPDFKTIVEWRKEKVE